MTAAKYVPANMFSSALVQMLRICTLSLAIALCAAGPLPAAAHYRPQTLEIRGKPFEIYVYDPVPGSRVQPYQVILTSGDLGWLGISVDLAERLNAAGYRVIGLNAREYLSTFTGKGVQLRPLDIPQDYRTILQWAAPGSKTGKFLMVGVSEGAGLTVLGAAQMGEGNGCSGIVALGLPTKTTLGWRWTDFPMWISKKDPREPMADTKDYVALLKLPLVMIHSLHDEWDPIDKARLLFSLAPGPKQLIPIDAANHRFSNKVDEVVEKVLKSLQWVQNLGARR